MNAHDLVVAVKDLALELGRTPLRDEMQAHVPAFKHNMVKCFGTYSALLDAAGLDSPRGKAPRITNAVFEKDLGRHLEEYRPREIEVIRKPFNTIAIISDIHWPFENQKVINAFYDYVSEHKPEYVIINGDARDFYSFSRFPRSHNLFTPKDELEIGRAKNVEFWDEIKKRSSKSKLIQTLGNHSARPMKQMLDRYPEAETWIEDGFRKEFTFDGVETIYDARQEVVIGDVVIIHGYRSGLGDHRDFMLKNVCVGHTHKGGVTYRHIHGVTLFELNSGYAGDVNSKGLSYTPQRATVWTPGFGVVDRYGARFISVAG